MGDEQHGCVAQPEQLQQVVLQFLACDRVQRREGFVQQQHRRFQDQRSGDGDAALLAAGKLRCIAVAQPGQPDQRQHRFQLFPVG